MEKGAPFDNGGQAGHAFTYMKSRIRQARGSRYRNDVAGSAFVLACWPGPAVFIAWHSIPARTVGPVYEGKILIVPRKAREMVQLRAQYQFPVCPRIVEQ